MQVQPPGSIPLRPVVRYAGFWRRFVAYMIDQLLMGVVAFMVFLPGLALLGLGMGAGMMEETEGAIGLVIAAIAAYLTAILVVVVLQWLYYALMESSNKQATLGKLALGIIVTDMDGKRLTFGRATGRYFGKILSSLILNIGFLMAAFTEKKQALHDLIASCVVVLK
ncbi:MAG TPA: RDD family protein [Bacteroidetes bacterium]|nr:MAG: hypothetical protein A2X66_07560 [Ignavibacteria bacterium GWA2_54_16]HCA79225.1 RDD family protein [Bacteroidota bacterium]